MSQENVELVRAIVTLYESPEELHSSPAAISTFRRLIPTSNGTPRGSLT